MTQYNPYGQPQNYGAGYPQQPQNPYGQQPGGPGAYGAPAVGQKPSFKGLRQGGNQTPISELVGQVQRWWQEPDNFGGIRFKMHLIQCQILKTDAAWPYSEADVEIRISDSATSGWGLFGKSCAQAFGIDIEQFDIDMLVNQWVHLVREDRHVYGQNQQTGQPMVGSVWYLHELMQPGQQASPVWPQYNQGQQVQGQQYPGSQGFPANGQQAPGGQQQFPGYQPPVQPPATPGAYNPFPQPTAPAPMPGAAPAATQPPSTGVPPWDPNQQQVGQQPVAVAVAPEAPAVLPPAQAPAPSASEPAATDPTGRAKQLLNGHTLAEWYSTALSDPTVRQDANIINGIMNNTLVEQWKQQGVAQVDAQGRHTVTG